MNRQNIYIGIDIKYPHAYTSMLHKCPMHMKRQSVPLIMLIMKTSAH